MHCPRCHDEFEPHVTWCGSCGVDLVPEGAEPPPPPPDAPLGLFHPAVARELERLLAERGVPCETVTREGDVELVVPRDERDDLRTEVTMTWDDVLDGLEEEQVDDVQRRGGDYPGWIDSPVGGWVDREGRLIVDGDDTGSQPRTIGPTLAVAGAVLLLLAWWAGLGSALVVLGVAMVLLGLLLPR